MNLYTLSGIFFAAGIGLFVIYLFSYFRLQAWDSRVLMKELDELMELWIEKIDELNAADWNDPTLLAELYNIKTHYYTVKEASHIVFPFGRV